MGFVWQATRAVGQNKENGNIAALLSRLSLHHFPLSDNHAVLELP